MEKPMYKIVMALFIASGLALIGVALYILYTSALNY